MKYLVNLAALAVLAAAPVAAATPDLNGVWQVITPVTALTTTDGKAPPLTPAAQKVYDQRRQMAQTGDHSFDTTLKCKPMGEPRTAYDPSGGPFEILQNPKEVVFGYTWNRMIRFVYLSPKAPDVIGPAYYGTATGVWHDDRLVIDAEGFHDTTLLDASGMPHTEDLRLTETYQLANHGRILDETIRFDDPASFTRPWQTRISYRRLPGARIAEDVCIERLHVSGY